MKRTQINDDDESMVRDQNQESIQGSTFFHSKSK